jgi:hypothetical protein
MKSYTTTSGRDSVSYPSSFLDINGDGMVDMLYVDERKIYRSATDGGDYTRAKYAILVNN